MAPRDTRPDRQPRRGAVAVIRRDGALLVIRRSRWVAAPRALCFPGGGIEPGETEEQALVRELEEELHIEARPLRRLWRSQTAWRVDLNWWLAEIDASAAPRVNWREVESFHWWSLERLRAAPALLSSNREFLDAVQRGEISLEP